MEEETGTSRKSKYKELFSMSAEISNKFAFSEKKTAAAARVISFIDICVAFCLVS